MQDKTYYVSETDKMFAPGLSEQKWTEGNYNNQHLHLSGGFPPHLFDSKDKFLDLIFLLYLMI